MNSIAHFRAWVVVSIVNLCGLRHTRPRRKPSEWVPVDGARHIIEDKLLVHVESAKFVNPLLRLEQINSEFLKLLQKLLFFVFEESFDVRLSRFIRVAEAVLS